MQVAKSNNPTINLKTLSDDEVLKFISSKVQAEKKLVTEIIEFVKEVDRRRLFEKLGFSSLYAFMTKHLGYTPGSAQRRIDAAKLLDEVPELRDSLKSGEHNLMQISTVARAVREKEKTASVSTAEKREILFAIQSHDVQQSEQMVSQMLDIPIKTKEIKRVQKDESVRMELTLSKVQMELFEETKNQMSHVNPNPTFAEVFEYLATRFIKSKTGKGSAKSSGTSKPKMTSALNANAGFSGKVKQKPATSIQMETSVDNLKTETNSASETDSESKTELEQKTGSLQKTASAPESQSTAKMAVNPRYVPAPIRKQIFQEQKCCQWKNGHHICGSKFQLQIDHIKPIWAGGTSVKENLQLLCSAHNRQRYLEQTNRCRLSR